MTNAMRSADVLPLKAIEDLLDRGRLEARVSGGRWWRVRRNGKTQTWKTRPDEFRIPVKAGFRACGELTHQSMLGPDGDFRVAPEKTLADAKAARIADGPF